MINCHGPILYEGQDLRLVQPNDFRRFKELLGAQDFVELPPALPNKGFNRISHQKFAIEADPQYGEILATGSSAGHNVLAFLISIERDLVASPPGVQTLLAAVYI